MTDSTLVRPAKLTDVDAIAQIYNHYVNETVVTFEVEPISGSEMAQRIDTVMSDSFPWFVAEKAGAIIGYAYASKWHARSAYQYSAESTVYLSPSHERQGIGSSLYERLFRRLVEMKLHTVIGGIALPNAGSVALHEKFGFQKAAHYRELGFKFGRWIDVGYWQRML